jgi:hypothetical protein
MPWLSRGTALCFSESRQRDDYSNSSSLTVQRANGQTTRSGMMITCEDLL